MTDKLSHFDSFGRATMVDVSAKAATRREAIPVPAGPNELW